MNFGHLLLGFDGRISRQPGWIGLAILAAAELLARWLLDVPFFPQTMKPFPVRVTEAAIELVTLYPTAAVVIKRLHDRNQPGIYAAWLIGIMLVVLATDLLGLTDDPNNVGWLDWVLAFFVVGILLAFLIELGFRRGTQGENHYGPDPLGGGAAGGQGPEKT
jgi:uncharacterized membrane protein YhaH (DUF805 family)